MGQTTSTPQPLNKSMDDHEVVKARTVPEILNHLALANSIASRYTDPSGRRLDFQVLVNKQRPDLVSMVKIRVTKVPGGSKDDIKHLNFAQFYTLLKLMLEYMTTEEGVRLKSFNAFYSNPSTLQLVPVSLQPGAAAHVVLPPTPVPIFNSSSGTPGATATPTGASATSVGVDEDSLECPICMEAKPEVVLTCTHGFCNRCLKQWSHQSPECPICRQLSSGDDGFIITDHTSDVARYFQQQLESLSSQHAPQPAKPPARK